MNTLEFLKSLKMNPDDAELMAKGARVPQPRFDAAGGVGIAGGATLAGGALGLTADKLIEEYLKTQILQQQGKSSQQLAKAVEAAYGDKIKGKKNETK
jgi:hypothetical protein